MFLEGLRIVLGCHVLMRCLREQRVPMSQGQAREIRWVIFISCLGFLSVALDSFPGRMCQTVVHPAGNRWSWALSTATLGVVSASPTAPVCHQYCGVFFSHCWAPWPDPPLKALPIFYL